MTVAEILGPDILIVLAVILVLFGASRLPKLARSLGEAKREFSKGMDGQAETATHQTPSTSAASPDGSTSDQAPGPAA